MPSRFQTIIALLLAIIPALIWMFIFLRKERSNKILVLLTFMGGMVAAKLILIYQGYWDTSINLIYAKIELVDFRSNLEAILANAAFASFVVFLGVGVMEEYLKFWLMRFINRSFFKSINDVIELAIVAALGFAFFENIIYFVHNLGKLSTGSFFVFVLFRTTVVTMVHLLCSGILGYYYGMAHFASPMLQIQYMKRQNHPVLNFFKKFLHLKRTHVYHDSMLMKGLLIAMVLHALYDFIMDTGFTVAGFPVYVVVMAAYLFGGFWLLSRLLEKKEHHLRLGLVGTKVMPKEDFIKLLGEIQVIKDRMRTETIK